jgi:hypothetical protein
MMILSATLILIVSIGKQRKMSRDWQRGMTRMRTVIMTRRKRAAMMCLQTMAALSVA